MTAKEWLLRARKLEERIVALQESRRRAYDRAVSATVRPRDVCVTGGKTAAPDDKTAGYASVGEEIDAQLAELNRIRAEILRMCRRVEDNTLAALLIEYYVNGKTWEQVAVGLGCSWRHVHRLHARALKKLEEVIECHIPPAV